MQISSEKMILTSHDAEGIFGPCTAIDGDYSLYALIRAIVIKYGEWTIDTLEENSLIKRMRTRSLADMIGMLSNTGVGSVFLCECVGCFDDEIPCGDGWLTDFEFNGKKFPVNQYLSQYGRTKVYVNKELKRIVAYVDRRISHVWVQAFESVLCRLMTWYFPLDLSDEEMQFFKKISVGNKLVKSEETVDTFVQFVNSASEKINFREVCLHRMLDGIANRTRQTLINNLTSNVKNLMDEIESLRRRISEQYKVLDEDTLKLNSLKMSSSEKDDSIFKFFNTHKQLSVLEVTDTSLKFGVDDTLEFYDEDEFERIYNNSSSFLGNCSDKMRKALWAIFMERRGLIRVHAVFLLESFKMINPLRRGTFLSDSMPNPHIYFHACSGGNETYYYQYAESGDWDLAIEQAIAATKNLNWGDSIVSEEMTDWLADNEDTPCIYVNDDYSSPVGKVTKEMKLVSFRDFMEAIAAKEGEESNG